MATSRFEGFALIAVHRRTENLAITGRAEPQPRDSAPLGLKNRATQESDEPHGAREPLTSTPPSSDMANSGHSSLYRPPEMSHERTSQPTTRRQRPHRV